MNRFDKFLCVVGTLSAVIAGMILPSISFIMANVASAFSGEGSQVDMTVIAKYVVAIAVGLFLFSYMFYAFWQQLAENITIDLRKRYLSALMEQEIGYFDRNRVEQIPSQMAEIFETCQGAIGEKFSNMIYAVSTCISGIIYGFYFAPVYAAICVLYLPFLLTILGVFGRMVQRTALQKVTVVKNLGGIAEETLTAIKVVASFGREEKELDKFVLWSLRTLKIAKRSSATMSFMMGLMKFCIFFFYTYALLIGSMFISQKKVNGRTGQVYG
jgi:ABC-type multidrug transport system fused ATPase/permease subunit